MFYTIFPSCAKVLYFFLFFLYEEDTIAFILLYLLALGNSKDTNFLYRLVL